MSNFPMDAARWTRGRTLDQFVAAMRHQQDLIRRRLQEVTLAPDDSAFFERVAAPVHALVMTEDWCGDSAMNLPILAKIVQVARGMDLRIWTRSQSPELNDYYQARGITHIPVFTFLDADWKEMGTWVERPQPARSRIREWLAAHPEASAVLRDPTLTPEARRERFNQAGGREFLAEMERWYADGLQQATVDEIKGLLLAGEKR
ncbi:MAG: thioredoxin family protein [Chloroflexi bacterium]|nr:thioredoxin family protein [Chloroflexota bacterium]